MIVAETNYAYVREMEYPELFAWANEYGFSVDELAWIQRGYTGGGIECIGKGANGSLRELYVDNSGQKLYIGGTFSLADSSVSASNIAYITESNGTFTYHNLGNGVNGTVTAIAEYNSKIFVAGNFTTAGSTNVNNIAYWDGSSWHAAGCISGTINDFIVYKKSLYAVGDFDVCAALSEVNFAKWSGSAWQQLPGLVGNINAAYTDNNKLVLGGHFNYQNDTVNIINWDASSGFSKFTKGISNEVMDIKIFKENMYAGCKVITPRDSTIMYKLSNNQWNSFSVLPTNITILPTAGSLAINTMLADNDTLFFAGNFKSPTSVLNTISNGYQYPELALYPNWFCPDSSVFKVIRFKNSIVMGGEFNFNYYSGNIYSIARKAADTSTTTIPVVTKDGINFSIYPNPTHTNTITIENNFNATKLVITDLQGKTVLSKKLVGVPEQLVTLPVMTPGIYLAEIKNENGQALVQRLYIR